MVLGATDILQLTKDRIEKGFICFEKFLTDNEYVAGDRLTLADFSVWSLLEAITKHMGVTAEQYPKIFGYMEKLREELPFKNLVLKDISDFGQVLHLYRKE
jgi:glutathione S-transferase